MQPLEHRRWFVLISLALAFVVVAGLWSVAELSWRWQASTVFAFAWLGVAMPLNRFLAIYLIRRRPALGEV